MENPIDYLRNQLAEQKKRREINNAFRRLFATQDGKIVIRHLIKEYVLSISTNLDPVSLAWRTGRRDLISQIAKLSLGSNQFVEEAIQEISEQIQQEEQE